MLQEHKRRNRSFGQTHLRFAALVASSGIRAGDRAVVGHEVLSQTLDLAVHYDQLNVANLASMEVITFRRMAIEDACRVFPEHPRLAGAAHMIGFRTIAGRVVFNPVADQDTQRRIQSEEAAQENSQQSNRVSNG